MTRVVGAAAHLFVEVRSASNAVCASRVSLHRRTELRLLWQLRRKRTGALNQG